MYTTQLDNGIGNIYPTEPLAYYAEYPGAGRDTCKMGHDVKIC